MRGLRDFDGELLQLRPGSHRSVPPLPATMHPPASITRSRRSWEKAFGHLTPAHKENQCPKHPYA